MKSWKKLIALLLAMSMLVSLLAACGSSSSGSTSSDSASSGSESTGTEDSATDSSTDESSSSAQTVITVGWINDVEGLDPASSNNDLGMYLVYDTLFENNPDTGELEGRLVESYEWIDDTHLQLTLYADATFSNGDPVTPQDVLFSFQYYVEAGSNLSTYYDGVYDFDNWEFVDDQTFIIAYCEPYGPGLSYLTKAKIQSEAYYNEYGSDAYWDSPCGSGPYEVTEQVAGSYTVYTLREDYWGETPEVYQYVVKTYAEASTMYIDFENGVLDLAWNLDASDTERAQNGSGDYELVLQSKLDVTMFTMASYCEPFQSIDVRHAIAVGVDWEAVAEAAYGILYSTPTSTLPQGVNYKIDVGSYEYDPEYAKELLAAAGYEDGFTFSMVTTTDTTTVRVAEMIQAYLLELGIVMELESYEIATAVPMFMAGAADSTIKVTGNGANCLEPDQIYDTMKASSTNLIVAITDSDFDSYLMNGLATVDTSERAELYEAAQQWLYANYQAIPIAEPFIAYVYNTTTISSFVGGGGLFPNLRYVHIA